MSLMDLASPVKIEPAVSEVIFSSSRIHCIIVQRENCAKRKVLEKTTCKTRGFIEGKGRYLPHRE